MILEISLEFAKKMFEFFEGRAMGKQYGIIRWDDPEVCLVLSSKKTHYYRTSKTMCTCKAYHYMYEKYAVGYCRHLKLAYPDEYKKAVGMVEKCKGEDEALRMQPHKKLSFALD